MGIVEHVQIFKIVDFRNIKFLLKLIFLVVIPVSLFTLQGVY